MTITAKLTKKEYINANFIVFYSKPSIRIFTILVSAALIISIVAVIGTTKISLGQVIAPIVMLGILPLLIYSRASRSFASSNMGETIEYKFDQASFNIKSEAFNSQMNWSKIYKVTQTKNWLLVWQNKSIATPIPKRDIQAAQKNELKEILISNKVKNNL